VPESQSNHVFLILSESSDVMFYRRLKRILPVVFALRRRHVAFLVCAVADEVSVSADRGDLVKCTTAKNHFVKMRKEEGFKVELSDGLLLYYDRFSFYSQKVKMEEKHGMACMDWCAVSSLHERCSVDESQ